MKKAGLFIFVAALAMLLGAVPAFAGKKALSENDMDLVTAAGQPEVLIAGTAFFGGPSTFTPSGPVTLTVSQDLTFAPLGSAQTKLRALTLNNVVGENELATVMNIQASPGGSTAAQANTVEQSWGSTVDLASTSGANGAITIEGKCIACVNTAGTAGTGSVGISGKAIATTDTVGSGGGVKLSIYADEVILGSPINLLQASQADMALGGNVQNGVAALVVNNVIAFNQLASALNISSGSVNLAADPALAQSSNVALSQSNLINQYRGTPFKRP